MFRLAFRQTEGLIGSVIGLLGLDLAVPDHTTLCRRAETLEVPRPRPSDSDAEPVDLLVDSTGLKLCGAGEWLIEKHGTRRRRAWRKMHIGVDADTGRIVASELTTHDVDDGSQVGPLLDQVAGPVASFTGDGAYDRDDVLADRLGIGHVVLLPLDKGLDVRRRDQLHHVAELGDLAPPLMSAATGLHGDRAGRERCQECQKLAAAQLLAKHNSSRAVGPMELKHVLGEIQSDGAHLVHGSLLEWSSIPPLWHTEAIRGVHTIRPRSATAGAHSRKPPCSAIRLLSVEVFAPGLCQPRRPKPALPARCSTG